MNLTSDMLRAHVAMINAFEPLEWEASSPRGTQCRNRSLLTPGMLP